MSALSALGTTAAGPLSVPRLTPRDPWRRLRKALVLLRNRRFRHALRHGVAAAIEHRHLASLRARTVIDAGAHRGQFALLALELFPTARVFAFEPLAGPRAQCCAALAGEARLTIVPAALGRNATERAMYVAAHDDCSSLLAPAPDALRVLPQAWPMAAETVRVVPLAEVITPDQLVAPALLKIDVQGFEREVLEGAGELLARFDAIYLEAWFRELYLGQALAGELIGYLAGRGFALDGVYNLLCDASGRALQADLDFRRVRHGPAALGHHDQSR
jgi:FkbM family methyltransferase